MDNKTIMKNSNVLKNMEKLISQDLDSNLQSSLNQIFQKRGLSEEIQQNILESFKFKIINCIKNTIEIETIKEYYIIDINDGELYYEKTENMSKININNLKKDNEKIINTIIYLTEAYLFFKTIG